MASPCYEFGPFHLDPAKRLLIRDRKAVTLTPKAFDALLVLIEKRERVVSKDELLERLWPDTIVDESSLTQTIFLLRRVLNDSTEDPEYIATIPRRGYRFVQPITVVLPHDNQSTDKPKRRAALRWAFAGAVAVIMGAGWLYSRRTTGPADRGELVLADFVNATGEKIFDETLGQALAVHLGQSPFLAIISKERVNETLKYMRKPGALVVASIASEVCQRLGAKAVLTGNIGRVGSHYVIGLEVTSCPSGETLSREQIEVSDREQVLDGLGQAATHVRRTLGESLGSIERFDVPISRATTESLEALKAFSVGEERHFRDLDVEARAFFKRAIEIDPDFALAYDRLAAVSLNLEGPSKISQFYARQAFERLARVSERERLNITARYHHVISGDAESWLETLQMWALSYPHDWYALHQLSVYYAVRGAYDKALPYSLRELRENPGLWSYGEVDRDYSCLNRFSEAKAIDEQAIAHGFDSLDAHASLFNIAFIEGDNAAMERHAAWARGKPEEGGMLLTQADAAMVEGRLGHSLELLRQARQAMASANSNDRGEADLAGAWYESVAGNYRRASQLAVRAAGPQSTEDERLQAAQICAFAGDRQAVSRLMAGDRRARPFVEAVIEALLAIDRRDPDAALELLRVSPYETGRSSEYLPVYVRGLAYLAMNDGLAAAAEFQRIIDHRGAAKATLYPLAFLQQGRAYAIASSRSDATRAYARFLELWQHADADLPVLVQARQELAALK